MDGSRKQDGLAPAPGPGDPGVAGEELLQGPAWAPPVSPRAWCPHRSSAAPECARIRQGVCTHVAKETERSCQEDSVKEMCICPLIKMMG